MSRPSWRPGVPLLAMAAGWVSLFSWSGMVAEPGGFLLATLLVGLVMVLAGSGLRVLAASPYVVAAVQVAIALLFLNLFFAARQSLLAVLPTPESVRHVAQVIGNGASTLNSYTAPVEANPTHTRAMLVACALLVLLAIDVLAMGLRRPPLVALPLLVTVSVPVSILQAGLALPVFVGTALLFLRLLAVERIAAFGAWGAARSGRPRAGGSTPTARGLTTLWQVSIAALLLTLLAAPLIPVTDLLHRQRSGDGEGLASGGFDLNAANPFVRLRRDLVARTHTPLVYAETTSRSTAYLRTTVLDEFTDEDWRPSSRILPAENDAHGVFPSPPGLSPGVEGPEDTWSLQLAPRFSTTWLPLPYPIRDLDVPGSWRYDSRTLDVAFVGGDTSPQLRYRATAFTPSVTAALLQSSARPPETVLRPMTQLPRGLPAVIRTRAEEVTRGAKGDFAKAVALQDWFRNDGGFRYSLEQRSGSGMDLLASFVTTDRVGYCEQFAAAMAAMGRTLGIPSRVVVGFLDGTARPDGRIVYTSDDQHAWPEMYFAGAGWVRFEPTPSQRAGVTPAYTRQDTTTARPSAAPSAAAPERAAPRRTPVTTSTSARQHQQQPVPWWSVVALLVLLAVGLAVGVVPGLVRRLQRRRRLFPRDPVHLSEGAWAELRATALDVGLEWPELRSPREQAQRIAGQVDAQDDDLHSLEGLLLRVERGRYARAGAATTVDAEVRTRTVETVSAWRQVMVDSVSRERGWRSRIWPVSLLRSGRR